MKQHYTITHLLIIILLLLTGCKKEEMIIDPRQAIIGKWEITHLGERLVENAVGYEEYLQDSVHVSYFYDGEEPYLSKYWFEDSLIYISTKYTIVGEDEAVTFTWSYKYEFNTINHLKLDLQNVFALETRAIYKRIN